MWLNEDYVKSFNQSVHTQTYDRGVTDIIVLNIILEACRYVTSFASQYFIVLYCTVMYYTVHYTLARHTHTARAQFSSLRINTTIVLCCTVLYCIMIYYIVLHKFCIQHLFSYIFRNNRRILTFKVSKRPYRSLLHDRIICKWRQCLLGGQKWN